jgi:ribosome-associated toxin RatA of RatAB toxin-antitoxin module
MRTLDEITLTGSMDRAFEVASAVERWPAFLPHYRWVTMLEPQHGTAVVEMAAWRPFGIVKYPTWWVSTMEVVPAAHQIRYTHIKGITAGMDVVWQLSQRQDHIHISIVHEWTGPRWPVIGGIAANLVIGPVFIHGIARRTLEGVKRESEQA